MTSLHFLRFDFCFDNKGEHMPAARPKIGILTGGGDAPGLNSIIESCSRALVKMGYDVVGICDGFEGVFEQRTQALHPESLIGLHAQAGTVLGTSNRSRLQGREDEFVAKFKTLGLEGLIAAGGDGTFAALSLVADQIPLIGVPKTIDNDLQGTDITFGFDTACAVVSESVDALRATAHSHQRIIVVETMGRTAGWIALGGGLASFADAILIPEIPFDRQSLLSFVKTERARPRRDLMIVVSEGATAINEKAVVAFEAPGSPQKERYGGVSQHLARWLEQVTGWESRNVVLGHLQRSRHPTTTDRFLTLTMGVRAAEMAQQKLWNSAVTYRQGKVITAPLKDFLQQAPRLVTDKHPWILTAKELGIYIPSM